MERKTQKQKVIEYMTEHGSITTFEAFMELNITRLAEYIRQLKEDGYDVRKKGNTKKRTDGSTVYWETFWIENNKKIS